MPGTSVGSSDRSKIRSKAGVSMGTPECNRQAIDFRPVFSKGRESAAIPATWQRGRRGRNCDRSRQPKAAIVSPESAADHLVRRPMTLKKPAVKAEGTRQKAEVL